MATTKGTKAMRLTRAERLVLANQYRILEKLYPEEASYFENSRSVVEQGYELEYAWIAERVYDEAQCLSTEECREVYKILQMHEDLVRSYESLADKTGIDKADILFCGFDGNHEAKWLGYCEHVCEPKGDRPRFTELSRGDHFNSHMPMLDVYRRMLKVWKPTEKKGL